MKKIIHPKLILLIVAAGVIVMSCQKGKIDPYYRQFVFFAGYTKPTDVITSAKLTINTGSLPKQIQISNPTASPSSCQTGRVCMTINNVRLKDELGIYDIEKQPDVVTEELRSGVWEQDVENKLTLTKTQNLDIVLVLDYSSSLGTDIANVRNYAINFINSIRDQNSGARVGVVTFSNNIYSLALTNNYALATNFVNTQAGGADETKLYEAIDRGISLFQGSTAEGKALVTFTDGKNNSWSNQVFQTFDQSVTKLKTNIGNPATLIASYTIGLNGKQGGVDAAALNTLAMNGGISAVAPNTSELEKIFKKFANSVSAIYTMTYNRNSSKITDTAKLRFVINTKLQ